MVAVDEGLQGQRGASARGHNTSRFQEKMEISAVRQLKKGAQTCPWLRAQEWVGSEGFGVQWTMRGRDGAGTGSHSPGGSGWAELLVQTQKSLPVSLPRRREWPTPAQLRGYSARIPLRRPMEGSGH